MKIASKTWRILSIDDNVAIHDDYRKVLMPEVESSSLDETESLLFGPGKAKRKKTSRFRYEIDSAAQGQDGFSLVQESIEQKRPYSAALIDVRMPPGWDGIETTKRIWEVAPDLPIVLCTAFSDYDWEQISDQLPHAEQLLILKKPFDPMELRQIVASQVTRWNLNRRASRSQLLLETIVDQRTQEIESTRNLVFTSLAKLAESRDPETGEHLERIQYYTRVLLERLSEFGPYQDDINAGFINYVSRSSILHDIGKVGIPDSVLLKPGRLTSEEFEVMKTHATIGADALDDAANRSKYCDFLRTAAEIARYHHEKFDGNGYPEQLKGSEIPLSARVVAVADVFDALTSERVYKGAMCPLDARKIIESERGKHFDPVVVEAFLYCWDCFHQGALENQANATAARSTLLGDSQPPQKQTARIAK